MPDVRRPRLAFVADDSMLAFPRARLSISRLPTTLLDWGQLGAFSMAELFLSYAHEDIKIAERLAALLEANDLDVWWDRRLVPGDKIHDVIDEQIESAKAVIVLWSPISVKSDWVRGEASTAHELKKLVPIKIQECKLPINYRGIHTPEVYKKSELHKLAQMLTDKFKAPEPLTQGTAREPAPKIEFTDKSADGFVEDLRTQFEKERAELPRKNIPLGGAGYFEIESIPALFGLIRKNPLGAAASFSVPIGVFLLALYYLIHNYFP
jgi:hypothetical protein